MAKLGAGMVRDAVIFPFRHPGAVLRLGLFPVLIFLAAAQVAFSLLLQFGDELRAPPAIASALLMLPLLLIYLTAASILAVGIHRLIIRGERPRWAVFRLGRYERAHLAVMLVLLLLVIAAQILFAGINWLGEIAHRVGLGLAPLTGLALVALSVAALAAALWIFSRLALALPHAAVAGELSLRTSWNALDGHFWRFAVVFLILNAIAALACLAVTAPIMVAGSISPGILAPGYGPPIFELRTALLIPVTLLMLAMLFALLAYAYKEFIEARSAGLSSREIPAAEEKALTNGVAEPFLIFR